MSSNTVTKIQNNNTHILWLEKILIIPIMNSYLLPNTKTRQIQQTNTEERNHINNFCIIVLLNASEKGLWKLVLIPKSLFKSHLKTIQSTNILFTVYL